MQTAKLLEFYQLVAEALMTAEKKHPTFCQKATRLRNPKFYAQMAAEYQKANDADPVQNIEMVTKEELYEMLEAAAVKNYRKAFLEAIDLAVVAFRNMEFFATRIERNKARK